jgi:hypothetical protein
MIKKNAVLIVTACWLAAGLAGVMTASAAVSVQFTGVSPGVDVNLTVRGNGSGVPDFGPASGFHSGIYDLLVNGVAVPSLSIDLARPTGTSSDYSVLALSGAPLPPAGPMTSTQQTDIRKLFAAYFAPALADATGTTASALQLAVWETLGDGSLVYTVTGNGPSSVTTLAATFIASIPSLTAEADLTALVSPTLENYVVSGPIPSGTVPDGGTTAVLLGAALSGLGLIRRKLS